jgi:hypothetical protein
LSGVSKIFTGVKKVVVGVRAVGAKDLENLCSTLAASLQNSLVKYKSISEVNRRTLNAKSS